MTPLRRLLKTLADAPAVLVDVEATQGSTPREAGTWMAVFACDVVGTIGGGRLEFDAIAEARARLAGAGQGDVVLRYGLGPSLGQCCGGVVFLRYSVVGPADVPALRIRLAGSQIPVALFGGGHVGSALARVLAPLPFSLTWIDSRDEIFPQDVLQGDGEVVCEHSDPVHGAVPALPAQSRVLIMSFSHAEDLDVVAACLQRHRTRGDLPFIGLIGSATKWATFRNRLRARGFSEAELEAVTCPIGVPGIAGKEPEVIAVAVAAQLLQTMPSTREA